ncbi:rheacalcin-1-like [Oxyura jamaicensis]|uniref:rheacalcin-1-like n=1 Tax=Oxyura jamaicensis TaxID=8884 RepID=UPI0015A64530|nr:rheacalcin-1-like [Oxyura jamaicensis]
MGPATFLGLCLLGFLALPSLPGVQASKCPRGWLDFRGSCYGYFGQELTWKKAEAWCKVIHAGCHLASLHSPEEHTAVARFVAKFQRSEEEGNVWIGLHHWNQARVWIDGSKKRYSAWDDDELPKGKYCTVLEGSSGFMSWEDNLCSERNPFVCKYSA